MVLYTWPERPKSHDENCFFQSKLQVFHDSDQIWTALELNPLATIGHIEKRGFPPQTKVYGCWNFHQNVHNFCYRYARKSFQGSNDADFGLVSKKILSQKNGRMGWAQGQPKVAKKSKNTPTCGSPPENPKPKTKIFFSISMRGLAESVEGCLNSSLALAAGDSWPKNWLQGKGYDLI